MSDERKMIGWRPWLCAIAVAMAWNVPLAAASVYPSYVQRLSRLPQSTTQALATQSIVGLDGAMGRNRRGYFHVRFQLGLHHWADAAIANRDEYAANRFLSALGFGLAHETPVGTFELAVPKSLSRLPQSSAADRASGTAFFLSSAGSGVLALQQSAWFQSAPDLAAARTSLDADKVKLQLALGRLKRDQALLRAADARAPNRLLFDALAFVSLGLVLHDEDAIRSGREYQHNALAQQSPKGFFVEGGGYDSSYNGVALAIGYRLLLMQPDDQVLANALHRALLWQRSRITSDGSILTQGNTRVSADSGERFLGREKQVDVPHCIEAFELAYVALADPQWRIVAERIIARYGSH